MIYVIETVNAFLKIQFCLPGNITGSILFLRTPIATNATSKIAFTVLKVFFNVT